MKTKEIIINDEKYIIRDSLRKNLLFQEYTGKSISKMDFENDKDVSYFIYCLLKGSNMKTFTYSYDEFIDDIIDFNPQIYTTIKEFNSEEEFSVKEEKVKKNQKVTN